MADDIIVYSVNGNAYRIESLTRSSTFLDFYQEARKALGLQLGDNIHFLGAVVPFGGTEL